MAEIEDAEWEEIPKTTGGKVERGLPVDPVTPWRHQRDYDANPWLDVGFWKSLFPSKGSSAIILCCLIGSCTFLALLSPQPKQSSNLKTQPRNTQTEAKVGQEMPISAAKSAQPFSETPSILLIGRWVQAETGGADGQTRCAQAKEMTTLNGGTTDFVQFFRSGVVDYTLWYDVAFERRGEPEVKAAYNTGNWSLAGDNLHLSWRGGSTGLFGSDLGPDEVGCKTIYRWQCYDAGDGRENHPFRTLSLMGSGHNL